MTKGYKPLGMKSYGSIGHLPNSRMGPADHAVTEGMARIVTEKTRDKFDSIVVQQKLDGSNVSVAKVDGKILALGRAGYLAQTSPFVQHQLFAEWVRAREKRFDYLLDEGERVVGEWLLIAHGTRYDLIGGVESLFAPFDIMIGQNRIFAQDVISRCEDARFVPIPILMWGPVSVENAMDALVNYYTYPQLPYLTRTDTPWIPLDEPEGIVYRVQRDDPTKDFPVVDFLAKYVRPDKVDGKYLDREVWNFDPSKVV